VPRKASYQSKRWHSITAARTGDKNTRNRDTARWGFIDFHPFRHEKFSGHPAPGTDFVFVHQHTHITSQGTPASSQNTRVSSTLLRAPCFLRTHTHTQTHTHTYTHRDTHTNTQTHTHLHTHTQTHTQHTHRDKHTHTHTVRCKLPPKQILSL
jgi:hypothetical protein